MLEQHAGRGKHGCFFPVHQVSSVGREDGWAWVISHTLPLQLFEDGMGVIFSACM